MLTKQEQLKEQLSWLKNAELKTVTITEKVALKKSRVTGEPTPEVLQRVVKFAVREGQLTGIDYETLIKKLRFKEASVIQKIKKLIFGDGFESQGSYTEVVTHNGAVIRHIATGKEYMRTYSRSDAPVHSRYYDGVGKDITDAWKELEKEYFPLKGKNASQGLEDPVIVNNTTLDNIKYIENVETGEVLYNELSEDILVKLGIR